MICSRNPQKLWSIGFLVLFVLVLTPVSPTRAIDSDTPAVSETITIGYSVQGQAIQAFRIGTGRRIIVLIGAIHGSEKNTAVLTHDLGTHFASSSHLLPKDTSLYIIPVLNQDGFQVGSRYNAHGVDLNRNWDTRDWQSNTEDSSGVVPGGGGSAPFSEPETAALAAWLLKLRDQANGQVRVLFYHAAYPPNGLVLAGSAGAVIARSMAAVIGYSTIGGGTGGWSDYDVTGMAIDWCRDQGMGCFEIELPSYANLQPHQTNLHATAVLSVLLWEQMEPGQRCFLETGFCLAGRIREFWEENNGLSTFGLPITRQQEEIIDGVARQVQWFERTRLELDPELTPPYDVLLGRLGVERLEQQGRDWWLFPRATPTENPNCRFFAETQHSVCGDILQAWRSWGLELNGQPAVSEAESLALFGMPISEIQTETLSDGQTLQVQWFERARFELHPQQSPSPVLLGLLGNEMQQAQARTAPPE